MANKTACCAVGQHHLLTISANNGPQGFFIRDGTFAWDGLKNAIDMYEKDRNDKVKLFDNMHFALLMERFIRPWLEESSDVIRAFPLTRPLTEGVVLISSHCIFYPYQFQLDTNPYRIFAKE
jgi:hypothetical protein